MKISRKFSTPDNDPLDAVTYDRRSAVITEPDGTEVFRLEDFEVPEGWSQLAADIVASKYFRKRGVPKTGGETSVRQVVYRVAHTIRNAGETLGGYFDTEVDAAAFEKELSHLLVNQMGAFNSPVWFNCGLGQEYKIKQSGSGHWYWDHLRERIVQTKDAYSHPQCSACYIQSVGDDLMNIFDLLKNEARLFKYGSGTGTNFSKVRGPMEHLSGGGTSSGLMSFLDVFDRGAGATKSGGITRRAAKMVTLDVDHPEVLDFISWKSNEEKKVAALIAAGYSADFNGEAYRTVSGQNSNNSIRLPDRFMDAYEKDGDWQTTLRTTGEVWQTLKARDVMGRISSAAWRCADPGAQYDTTINTWHTCPNSGRINGSNPCSEYMFLDDSACNLASINLLKFLDEDGIFDIERFRTACRIFFMAQEILIDFASYPTRDVAQNSHDYRPLGLGYANLGSLLMVMGVPYDSAKGNAICGAITAIMTAEAYVTSALMAGDIGPFPGYESNADPMLNVIEMHLAAVGQISSTDCPDNLLAAAHAGWDEALALGRKNGYRNAQATVLAPTGTIGLLMDCDTTGIEPDFALVKFKKLAGGGYFKIVNASVPTALERLGYTEDQIRDMVAYIVGRLSLREAPHINRGSLIQRGLTDSDVSTIEDALPAAFDLSFAISPWILGTDAMERLGFAETACSEQSFNFLAKLGFTPEQVEEANDFICGYQTIEGAPHIKPEHLAVFDCANKCGKYGVRYLEPMAHLRMMSAAQKFISGAISKTVNLPNETAPDDIEKLYVEGWRMGLKAVAIYRDGSKLSQPLSSSSSTDDPVEEMGEEKPAEPRPVKFVDAAVETAIAGLPNPVRTRLPTKRTGFTQEARVAGHKVFLRTGEYEDGTLGEIFIDMHKEGAPFRSMLNCFAISISKGLQYGVPLEELVETFTFTRFEPAGMVDHPNIRFATSVIDYVFRVLGFEYLGRTDFLQIKPEEVMESQGSKFRVQEEHKSPESKPKNRYGADSAETTRPVVDPGPSSSDALIHTPRREDTPYSRSSTGDTSSELARNVIDRQLSAVQSDAPFCDVCGHITIRNGACYKCLNCGNSMGCS
jgi:ribonucleoside-diphosphate reductase alpha chain